MAVSIFKVQPNIAKLPLVVGHPCNQEQYNESESYRSEIDVFYSCMSVRHTPTTLHTTCSSLHGMQGLLEVIVLI